MQGCIRTCTLPCTCYSHILLSWKRQYINPECCVPYWIIELSQASVLTICDLIGLHLPYFSVPDLSLPQSKPHRLIITPYYCRRTARQQFASMGSAPVGRADSMAPSMCTCSWRSASPSSWARRRGRAAPVDPKPPNRTPHVSKALHDAPWMTWPRHKHSDMKRGA